MFVEIACQNLKRVKFQLGDKGCCPYDPVNHYLGQNAQKWATFLEASSH